MSFMSIEEKQPRPRGEMTGGIPNLRTEVKHPRSRGENAVEPTGIAPAVETSPLTRGKLLVSVTLTTMGRKHPRSRGENSGVHKDGEINMETSPLTRGKLFPRKERYENKRNIPAHAGKTTSCFAWDPR